MKNEQLKKWHQSRHTDVTSALGDLSLIAMYEITKATKVREFKGIWQPVSLNEPGLTLTATIDDRLYLNGMLIEGTISVIADETVIHDEYGRSAMATSQPESLHLLAIWDENCAALKNFSHINTFAYNEQAIYKGKLVVNNSTFQLSHTRDESNQSRKHDSIGVIQVDIDSQTYYLRPFQSGEYSIIVFRDATSGIDTYGMGRMLVIQPNEDGSVLLDFNKAFLPPCAFSPYFNCPMPPLSNHIKTKVEAGEKHLVLFNSSN